MSSQPCEDGESWDKQFKRAVVAGGPLKGARYTDVGWDDLRKAAKSYRGDARFNQYAKRCLSERAFAIKSESAESDAKGNRCRHSCSWFCMKAATWVLAKARVKLGLVIIVSLIMLLLLSRPLFYVVVAKTLSLSVKLFLRRSIGLLVVLLDAILDEAAASLETQLISQPTVITASTSQVPQYELQQINTWPSLLIHGLCMLVGALLGNRMQRAQVPPRYPTRLRVV